MNAFIDKNRIYIAIGLIIIILSGIGILLWQNQINGAQNNNQTDLQNENEELKNQITELQNTKNNTADAQNSNINNDNDFTDSQNSGKININSASLKELDTLSGIGAVRAQQIIDYREKNGGFKSIEEIKNISGIGDKTFEKIKDQISI